MAKKKKTKKSKEEKKVSNLFPIPSKIKKIIFGVVSFLLSVVVAFSFFGQSGIAGEYLKRAIFFMVGSSLFIVPIVFTTSGLIIFRTRYKRFIVPMLLGALLILVGLSGIFTIIPNEKVELSGGIAGKLFGGPLLRLFDFWISLFILSSFLITGMVITSHLLKPPSKESVSVFKKIFGRKKSFSIDEIKVEAPPVEEKKEVKIEAIKETREEGFNLPPVDLLESDKGIPSSGDTKVNAAVIKKTLEDFDIPVEMSDVRVGPTVAQYTLKPSEGIKLSRITSLSNDLSLALAAHSIRIEAPIPGKSLVGIEIPNKVRAEVRLRSLIENPEYYKPEAKLPIVMGKDVAGELNYGRLEKMPHLLVAGSTGSGKTIFLNTLILSLLYKNTPETLRLILVDPKRVEFSNFEGIPHLLCPVIFDVNRTCNALKWLIGEMKRRLQIMSEARARDIGSYNTAMEKKGTKEEILPYIVLVVDELADLMMAKGKEVEAGIVRLAQMARAAGIHLVLTTQRPSVEVITGLIKANIISRVSFQVASQIDSRTILDTAGAEKLLGAGDMLYVTGDMLKPKRAQAPYVSEKEIKDVVKWIVSEYGERKEDELSSGLEEELEGAEGEDGSIIYEDDDDPLYEDAKKLVLENKKASASFLQRRMRIGYARAARLIDMMEDRGVVGPGEGAKPREIYAAPDDGQNWQKL